jgi:hypothetical protein
LGNLKQSWLFFDAKATRIASIDCCDAQGTKISETKLRWLPVALAGVFMTTLNQCEPSYNFSFL